MARLTANVATIYVGGASAVERGEVKLRVDDAVCAAKSALAGISSRWWGMSQRHLGGAKYPLSKETLSRPPRELRSQPDNFAEGVGYNLKTGEAKDMLEQNIIDPAIVIREAVINSHSVITKANHYPDGSGIWR